MSMLRTDQEFVTQTLTIRPVVDRVSMDEKCYGLMERYAVVKLPHKRLIARVRLQTILVVRNDTLCEFRRILGPSEDFKGAPGLQLISPYGEDTVGQCVDEAERSRDDTFERELRAELQGSSTLIADAIKEAEENQARIRNLTVLGPAHRKQRNNFPSELLPKHLVKGHTR